MRKICLLVALTFLFLSAKSQSAKYKAFQFAAMDANTRTPAWVFVDILVVIDFDAQKVKVYTEKIQDYDLMNGTKKYDAKNDGYTLDFEALDTDGKRCALSILMYGTVSNKHIGTLTVAYTDYSVAYRLAKDK